MISGGGLPPPSFPRRRESITCRCRTCDPSSPVVYILTNRKQGALYTGVTSDLIKRLHQHRTALIKGFTAEHGIKRLLWFERHEAMESAILREKRIKKWHRSWKIRLIEEGNPDWCDLALDFGFDPLPSLRV